VLWHQRHGRGYRAARAFVTIGENAIDQYLGVLHVIKFTEACLRRDAVVPSPAYRAAVDHVLGTMRRR
jgi:hypothetical protein